MPSAEIIRIAISVAAAQCGCDLLARHFIFNREPYQRSIAAFHRAKTKRDKIIATQHQQQQQQQQQQSKPGKSGSSQTDKAAKKIQRAEDEFHEAAADVAKRHTAPSFFNSIIFLILYRILSAEYSGKVIAVMPFQPWPLLQKLSRRGLGTDVVDTERACAFLLIYMLCSFSVKFVVNRLVGVHPPHGADGGVSTLLDAPKSQKVLKSFGVDTEEFNEARKVW
eukprot:CAMPEP_0172500750 /NCGR_PEP_ID=MMETSP1066-20121228/142595_1 /TAXON_ID=671091 /ORGANISM="Coscinodiscus wailesii, Strain CCMP2513" /LENGTH=222 /DNA_ID=CAMNT_0013275159 /DNA_START=105 /DNA_END=773 /DNA_ORIENTATION=+